MKNCNLIFGFLSAAFIACMSSCERDISVELPQGEEKIVVEGKIENGLPPYVVLSRSVPYFSPTSVDAYQKLFVHGAIVTVTNGSLKDTLTEYCSSNFTDQELELISMFLGITPKQLRNLNFCFYSTLNTAIWGEAGKNYRLEITAGSSFLMAFTSIPNIVSLDSVWFKTEPGKDSLGFAWAHLTDPDTIGNNYRWFAKRLGKDFGFIAPFGSTIDDRFFNGKSFDFAYDRGHDINSSNPDDHGEDAHYYRIGDTIVVRFVSLDKAHYDFVSSYERSILSNDNPFAVPASLKSNIIGGLGVWGGYAASYDTIIAR